MSQAYLDRSKQNHSNSNNNKPSQQKVDYQAQMKRLDMNINNPGWNTSDISPAQMFAEEEERQMKKDPDETANSNSSSYTVKSGESLSILARKHGVTTDALKNANTDKLQNWDGVEGFNEGEKITIPDEKATEEKKPLEIIQKLYKNYIDGKIDTIKLASELMIFTTDNGEAITSTIDKLPNHVKDNVYFAIANQSTDLELTQFDNSLLETMAKHLGGWFNTASWGKNWEQEERVENILALDNTTEDRINKLMIKNRLNPAEIEHVRELIDSLDESKRGDYYFQLQEKVKYNNQRDSIVKENGERVEKRYGGMCNLTSLSMVLQYLGISNPHPDMQYEDALEKIRQDNNFGSRLGVGWEQVAKKLGAEVSFILDRANTKAQNKDWWLSNVKTKLHEGYGIMMSIKGHIIRLQEINDSGIVVDDPYGKLNLQDRLNKSQNGGYEKYNESEWNWSSEGTAKEGEDNLWPWSEVENYPMWWIASFKK